MGGSVWLWCLLFVTLFHSHSFWRTDRRPRLFGDRIPRNKLVTSSREVQRKIVTYHNFFRTQVSPPAANMLRMSWHKGAARAAQSWAERCLRLTHDGAEGRWVNNFGSCGQNIFISTQQVPWFFAIRMWNEEKNNFTYGSHHNDLYVIGHYSQMVWDATHKVGCGFTKCDGGGRHESYYSYVCNYCPIGNYMERLGRPYEAGTPCSSCHGHCKLGKLCTNSCPAADMWANCRELNATWHDWLCKSHNREGKERRKFCKATCNCNGKII
ncbi:cysteine-rich secretory protein 3 [Anabrus simplex]|uniref:cysteine-rich secretory protein 3 n=1 Tax=Anabrus simplex TaxID=316456 RepID=UPI0034DCFB43